MCIRDRSIRGAGNLLGKQQHGFINSVGYDLYSSMLADAVAEKQGKHKQTKSDADVELGVEAYLPDSYVNDQRQKIELYKTIHSAVSYTHLDVYKRQPLTLPGSLLELISPGSLPTGIMPL